MASGFGTISAQRTGFTVKGKITDEKGETIPGVTIRERGTTNSGVSDIEGLYTLVVNSSSATLTFNFIGMDSVVEQVNNRNQINVVMKETTLQLGEVVVTGIFERKKEGFTGSAVTVGSEQIAQLTSGNALKALEMVDPGFRVGTSNLIGSNPNAIPDYQLRGSANIGDYSLDDVSVMRGDLNTRPNQPLFVLDGIIGVKPEMIMDLDPEQIQSMTLLKDAAATVVYGSEAANGVVVVETKKPVPGKLLITYNGKYGLSWPDFSGYNLCNAAEKLQVEKLAGYPDELPGSSDLTEIKRYYNALELDVLRGVNTDWLTMPVQTVFTQRHGINFEGGDQNLRYKVYLGANIQPGVMKGTGLNGQSGRVDIHYRIKNFQIINQTYLDFSKGSRESNYGYFSEYALTNPYYRPYDEQGNIQEVLDPIVIGNGGSQTYNPLWNTLFNSTNSYNDLSINEAIKLEYRPFDAFRTELDFTISKSRGATEMFQSAHNTAFATITVPEDKGSYSYTNTEFNSYRLSLTASYYKLFNKAHLVSLFGRYTINESDNYNSTLTMSGFPNDNLSEVFMGTKYQSVSGAESVSRSLGFVFTGNYAYKQRYVGDVSVRIDASSQFGKLNRYAPFWSVGLKWNGHNEDYIKQLKFIDELIIRGSYGTTGSQGFNSYQALQTYTYRNTMTSYTSSDVVGATLLALGNPALKWQQTYNANVGLDFTLFNGFFGARFEVYNKLTKNTLLDYTLAPSVGFSTIKENLGEISNKGYEFSVRFMPWKNNAKRAYWNITFAGAYNRSTIEKISDALKALNEQIYANTDSDLTKPQPQYVSGASNTAIWGVQSLGINPETGEEMFLTRDGQVINEWNARDRVVIGDKNPTLAGSISTTFAYKDLSITLSSRYTFGGYIYNQTLADKVENAYLRSNVDKRVLYDRWQEPGDIAKFKKIDRDINREKTKATSRFVEKNNEFNLSSININYRMGANDYRAIKRLGLSYATFGLYFEEILRISSVQMEYGTLYPFARTISFALTLAF